VDIPGEKLKNEIGDLAKKWSGRTKIRGEIK
jgi:hypothetical protein